MSPAERARRRLHATGLHGQPLHGCRVCARDGDHDVAEVIPHRDLADDQLADADMDWPEALATVTPPCYS